RPSARPRPRRRKQGFWASQASSSGAGPKCAGMVARPLRGVKPPLNARPPLWAVWSPTRRQGGGMRRALLCGVVAVLSMGAVACGSSSSGGATRAVQVDGTTDKYNGAFLAYFPKQVMVHPGDTVDFHENWKGEPHTVTMGTLVEA